MLDIASTSTVNRLEDPDRIEPADLCAGVEQPVKRPIIAGRREPPEQARGGCEWHARLGLVAREPENALPTLRHLGFVEQARLPDAGIADDDQGADAPLAPRCGDQVADRGHLVCAPDEPLAHRLRLRQAATTIRGPTRRRMIWPRTSSATTTTNRRSRVRLTGQRENDHPGFAGRLPSGGSGRCDIDRRSRPEVIGLGHQMPMKPTPIRTPLCPIAWRSASVSGSPFFAARARAWQSPHT